MKIDLFGQITKNNEQYIVPIIIDNGANARVVNIELESDTDYNPDNHEPVLLFGSLFDGVWGYKKESIHIEGGAEYTLDEIKLQIKHAVLSHNKKLKRMRREIEALERIENIDVSRREHIPETVRLYVWQRDKGRCVKCGSKEKLEFDHIIPVVKGGSNTERNIQLLCERCNRSKGSSI